MSVSHVSISVVYRPISMKSGLKVGLWTLTTEKILQSSTWMTFARVMKKLSQGSDIGLMVLNFLYGRS